MVRHMTNAERDECIQLYLQEWTLERLAERYNRERNTIIKLVKRRGANRGRPKWMTGLSRTNLFRRRKAMERLNANANI